MLCYRVSLYWDVVALVGVILLGITSLGVAKVGCHHWSFRTQYWIGLALLPNQDQAIREVTYIMDMILPSMDRQAKHLFRPANQYSYTILFSGQSKLVKNCGQIEIVALEKIFSASIGVRC